MNRLFCGLLLAVFLWAGMWGCAHSGGPVAQAKRPPDIAFAPSPTPEAREPVQARRSLFSWHEDAVMEEERDRLLRILQEADVTAVYQWFGRGLGEDDIASFTADLNQAGIDVYALEGDPSWALETGAKSFVAAIDQNSARQGIKGVVFDVEPQQTEEYDKDREAVMGRFAENMRLAYGYAADKGLEVIACISAHYDEDPELKTIIAQGCDAVAVMNYYRGRELKYIQAEAALAKLYGKGLICISELQPPGMHGLVENNTYYEQGLDAAISAWEGLSKALDYERLGFSFHEYEWLGEMLGK